MSELPTASAVSDLRARVGAWRAEGLSVGLVPTMGALHDGHLALVAHARGLTDRVVCSVFVNPKQFGPTEDFGRYPRRREADRALLAGAGAHLMFTPGVEEMYPRGFASRVIVEGVTEPLEGAMRPGHFEGVATVVTKLLLQAMPDVAVFGEKDFQQLRTISRLARDLDIPVRIVGMPTVREADGLAMSSRNAYLSPEERRTAPLLHRVLEQVAQTVAQTVAQGADPAERAAWAVAELENAGFVPDYVAVRDADSLGPPVADRPMRVLGAAKLGNTRLIDNLPVPPGPV